MCFSHKPSISCPGSFYQARKQEKKKNALQVNQDKELINAALPCVFAVRHDVPLIAFRCFSWDLKALKHIHSFPNCADSRSEAWHAESSSWASPRAGKEMWEFLHTSHFSANNWIILRWWVTTWDVEYIMTAFPHSTWCFQGSVSLSQEENPCADFPPPSPPSRNFIFKQGSRKILHLAKCFFAWTYEELF